MHPLDQVINDYVNQSKESVVSLDMANAKVSSILSKNIKAKEACRKEWEQIKAERTEVEWE